MMQVAVSFFGFAIIFYVGYFTVDASSCFDLLRTEALQALGEDGALFATAEQFATICPDFMSFVECFNKELAEREKEYSEVNIISYRGFEASFRDLCDEESTMRTKYLNHQSCLKRVERNLLTCRNASGTAYDTYESENPGSEPFPDQEDCFKELYEVGCMSDHILKTCGNSTLSVYQHFMSKPRFLADVCKPETAEALRTDYLEHLALEGDLKKTYEDAFNLA